MKSELIVNKEKDIKNWQESVSKQSHGVDWVKFLPEDISLECVSDSDCLSNYLENKYYSTGKIEEFVGELSKKINAEQIQEDLEEILQCKFKAEDYKIFITTFHRAPFSLKEHYFFVILKRDIERTISSIYHELMHFLFYQNWYEFCKEKGLSDSQINTFKEALTILLNDVLEKRGWPLDIGYSAHQELRKEIKGIRDNEHDFTRFLEKAIVVVKE